MDGALEIAFCGLVTGRLRSQGAGMLDVGGPKLRQGSYFPDWVG